MGLEGKVVHEDNEGLWPSAKSLSDVLKFAEVILGYFNQAQSAIAVAVQQRLDR